MHILYTYMIYGIFHGFATWGTSLKMIDNEVIFHIELLVYFIYGPLPLISTYNPIYTM